MAKNNFWERLFPVKWDFNKMLHDQALVTCSGMKSLEKWISSRSKEDYQLVFREADRADGIRFTMENNLVEAFVTPFDRQDIYSLSVEMDRIVEYAKSTLEEMEAFEVFADSVIIKMVEQLYKGTEQLAEAIDLLKGDPIKSQTYIESIREVQLRVEADYRDGMVELFNRGDLMYAMKYREVYHHIKDAAIHLGYTTDILHKVIVRIT
ncbi:DUF47 domain-containing protein [Pelosinus sp. UFO1]|uniref:DUF47 domain-containing protein n=1 Tax=Pelosinus sp. UFO1 TaxID=484770 RepID=UPI0004D1AAD0|nr:DUF47 family protein [Pelosinus sp. UFO1]AIF52732.1 Putative phosphate transport regulator [Pelosinus sp. UFO1]